MANKESSAAQRTRSKNKWAFPVGLIVLVLVIIGIVSVIYFGVGAIGKLTDNSKKREEYQEFIVPVVMNDPAPFDDLSQADPMELMESAVWALLRSDINTDEYAYEDGCMVIPQEDVKNQFVRLFGTDIEPKYGTIVTTNYEFTYDEGTKTYRVPITSTEPLYTPIIYDMDKSGKTTTLVVGYLAANGWEQSPNGDMVAPDADKFMKITLREKDDSYYISSIQVTDRPDTATTKEAQTETTQDEASESQAA